MNWSRQLRFFLLKEPKVTILCDVLRWGKSNLYGDKICNILSLIVFAPSFSLLILTLNIHYICSPFNERDNTFDC